MTLFIQNGNKLSHFISTLDKNESVHLNGITTVCENAFTSSNDLKSIFFDENLKCINKSAFEDSESLKFFCCGKTPESKAPENEIYNLKEVTVSLNSDSFTIQTLAFSGCKNLQTVILPSCKTLTIEKDAFSGCESLRTFVCECDKISFTENPFEECPENLTFIVKQNSKLERFARENGYRFINA
ncbi:leucine-rich repeat protein [Treponema saccharophilum]|uniref:Uncharacterized protein n=1 Tax=Treponema saccharophilum DSM 2985 TaxID=907348 RepID=H7EKY8_9SPIR|nr:leucine-rich repeat protein [Treponema saccharophilum]EIC01713.1 hypothetical protein TresaDRAFT_1002 [Treponema saccharophilum DSM 2985]BDC97093.1 hypothetical protein TRSA_21920 [Treponema saccharophilum]